MWENELKCPLHAGKSVVSGPHFVYKVFFLVFAPLPFRQPVSIVIYVFLSDTSKMLEVFQVPFKAMPTYDIWLIVGMYIY